MNSFVSGHGFSRAVQDGISTGALAPEGLTEGYLKCPTFMYRPKMYIGSMPPSQSPASSSPMNGLSAKFRPDYALMKSPLPNYFYDRTDCLVVSFDGSWYPFLDNTQGYNRRPQRWYIPKISGLLARVAQEMQTPGQRHLGGGPPGGRVFLHTGGALRRLANEEEMVLVKWELPKESFFLRNRRL